MDKRWALLFSIAGVIILIGVGAALSYRQLGIALLLILFYISFVGFGFVLKARMRRKKNG